MVETRIAIRHRVLKAGTIEFGSNAIDCMVPDEGKCPVRYRR